MAVLTGDDLEYRMRGHMQPGTWMVMALCVALGLAGTGAWLAEVTWVRGWDGLLWLDGFPVAAWAGAACAVCAYAVPFIAWHRLSAWRLARFLGIAYVATMLAFQQARQAIYALHSRSAALMGLVGEQDMARDFLLVNAGILVGAAGIAALGIHAATRVFLAPAPGWLVGALLLAIGLVMPLSSLTILVVPAINGSTDYIHAIKMGYPVFWTTVLLGFCGAMAARRTATSPS